MEAYLDAETCGLASADRRRLEDHVKQCAACRAELSRRRKLRELLAAMPVPPVPEAFARRVVARAKAMDRRIGPAERAIRLRPAVGAWHRLRLAAGATTALAAGLALGALLGYDLWPDVPRQGRQIETRQAGAPAGTGWGRLVIDYDDSLAQAYLELTAGHDG